MKLNYQESGHGTPLVFIHGLSDDLIFWDPIIPELSKHYHTLAIDLRGHGKSPKPETPYSIKIFSEDVYNFLKSQKIEKAHLIGFSMGGAIAQQIALKHPEMVFSLVLMSSFSFLDSNLKHKLQSLKNSLINGGFDSFFDEMLPLAIKPQLIQQNKSLLVEVKKLKIKTESVSAIINSIDACLDFNIKPDLNKILKPVLIVSGEDDSLINQDMAEKTNKLIKYSKLKFIENTAHNILIPQNIPEIQNILLDFLTSIKK
ncbi:MAG: alpha/beta hydrolase [Methanobacteriaceae archaeon]|nr:alpha/beta hydrolase [Methanobacteriaceae archaeon]